LSPRNHPNRNHQEKQAKASESIGYDFSVPRQQIATVVEKSFIKDENASNHPYHRSDYRQK
jgi:hypothetical protein